MDKIERFREICADGRALDERRKLAEIHNRTWKPSTVVKLEWVCNGSPVEIEHMYGLMAQVLPDRRSLALLRSSPRHRFAELLEFIDARGATHLIIASPLALAGKSVDGEFAWFEAPRAHAPKIVRVVFWARGDDSYFLLDVNAESGSIAEIQPLQ
jgi:hypothetical protein